MGMLKDAPRETNPFMYDIIRMYRNAIFSQYDSYYTNEELKALSEVLPGSEEEFLAIVPDRNRYDLYGKKFLELIRLFRDKAAKSTPEDQVRSDILRAEQMLHEAFVHYLKGKYGERWWFDGVPLKIRLKCAQTHEESGGDVPKDDALYLLDLMHIALDHWGDLKGAFGGAQASKDAFKKQFISLNDVRNRLSHPARLKTSPITNVDVDLAEQFVSQAQSCLDAICRQKQVPDKV